MKSKLETIQAIKTNEADQKILTLGKSLKAEGLDEIDFSKSPYWCDFRGTLGPGREIPDPDYKFSN